MSAGREEGSGSYRRKHPFARHSLKCRARFFYCLDPRRARTTGLSPVGQVSLLGGLRFAKVAGSEGQLATYRPPSSLPWWHEAGASLACQPPSRAPRFTPTPSG